MHWRTLIDGPNDNRVSVRCGRNRTLRPLTWRGLNPPKTPPLSWQAKPGTSRKERTMSMELQTPARTCAKVGLTTLHARASVTRSPVPARCFPLAQWSARRSARLPRQRRRSHGRSPLAENVICVD